MPATRSLAATPAASWATSTPAWPSTAATCLPARQWRSCWGASPRWGWTACATKACTTSMASVAIAWGRVSRIQDRRLRAEDEKLRTVDGLQLLTFRVILRHDHLRIAQHLVVVEVAALQDAANVAVEHGGVGLSADGQVHVRVERAGERGLPHPGAG